MRRPVKKDKSGPQILASPLFSRSWVGRGLVISLACFSDLREMKAGEREGKYRTVITVMEGVSSLNARDGVTWNDTRLQTVCTLEREMSVESPTAPHRLSRSSMALCVRILDSLFESRLRPCRPCQPWSTLVKLLELPSSELVQTADCRQVHESINYLNSP